MKKASTPEYVQVPLNSSLSSKIAILRIAFGIVWAVDAAFKFEPVFYRSMLLQIQAADTDVAGWLNPWFNFWTGIIGTAPHFFAIMVIVIEVLIALSLLLGVARRLNYGLAAIFSFLIWAIAEGFGGPYVTGSTDLGAGIIYVFVFLLLYVVDGAIPAKWSLDSLLTKRISWWHKISDR